MPIDAGAFSERDGNLDRQGQQSELAGEARPSRWGLLEQHKALQSVLLHLVPGVAALVGYLFLCVPLSAALGLPSRFAFVFMDILILIPLLLGTLLYLSRSRNGRFSLDGIVLNRDKLPTKQLVAICVGVLAWAALVTWLVSWTDRILLERVFYWVPASMLASERLDLGGYSHAILIGARVASIVFVGLLGPLAEELYFRGFLLPRMSSMGVWAPAWHGVLFCAYHFLSPWAFITRIFLVVPMVYVVKWKRSISIGIWCHCIGNSLGELLSLAILLQSIGSHQ
jgi:membrane protease YdiL (CAAX protease family)